MIGVRNLYIDALAKFLSPATVWWQRVLTVEIDFIVVVLEAFEAIAIVWSMAVLVLMHCILCLIFQVREAVLG